MDHKLSADDRFAIADLYYNYSFYMDDGEAQKLGDLFTEDARFELPGTEPLAGRDAMIGMCENAELSRPSMRHILSGVVAEPASFGATGRAYLQAFRYDETTVTLLSMGEYVDDLVRDRGTWRFKRRRFNMLIPTTLSSLTLATVPAFR